MDPKYKTLIPLIIIFFIIGIAVGYVAHKPKTIEKIEYVENKTIVTVTVTVTPSPTPTATPTTTATAVATTISEFTIKDYYNPDKDISNYNVKFANWGLYPDTLSIHVGESVVFTNADFSQTDPMTLKLNSSVQRNIGKYGGAVFVTFNKKGTYSIESIIPSSDPTIMPRTYAKGTIRVY